MATSITSGSLAFIGPSHVVGREAGDNAPELDVKVSVLRHRIVEATEAELWPGTFVGHPIAFVYQEGVDCDLWQYGLVTGYNMSGNSPHLHVRTSASALKIELLEQQNVIAADRLNYALSTGAGVNAMVLNAAELLDRQNQVIAACGKSRSGIPTSVTSTMLSVPYQPEERVPLIRPDTLQIVRVRRQHIVEHELRSRGSNVTAVFTDSVPIEDEQNASQQPTSTKPNRTTNQDVLTLSDSDDSGSASGEAADIAKIRLQNRSLRKRIRDETVGHRLPGLPPPPLPPDATRTTTHINGEEDKTTSSFRPSVLERRIHDAIVHPDLKGKNPQAILETVQQAPDTMFLATPPVLRAAYDFSFGLRGLSTLHFRPATPDSFMKVAKSGTNMTNFSRKNNIQPPVPPTSITEILDSISTLLRFARSFYNAEMCEFIKAGETFLSSYSTFTRPDAATCSMLVFWLDNKFGRFRSQVISSGLSVAVRVREEFTRHDNQLTELYQAQQESRVSALVSDGTQRTPLSDRRKTWREHRHHREGGVPKEVIEMLPKQGGKTQCLRYLSKRSCNGPSACKCYAYNRAHFRPLALPADAKNFIDSHFGGLAAEFEDL